METADARATLVDLAESPDAHALTVTLPRRHVEEALSSDEPIDLVLDLARRDADGDPGDTGRIAVAWEHDELEELLRRSGDDSVSLVFDEDALARMLDPEFEAHGMREALAVLAVAVAAGGGAAAASAQPAEYTGIGPGGTTQITAPAPGADIEAARSAAAQPAAPTAASGIEAVRSAAAQPAAPTAASGIEAVRSAAPLVAAPDGGALASASGIEAVRSAEPLAAAPDGGALASSSGIEAMRSASPLGADTATLASSSGGIEGVRSAEAAATRTPAPADGGIALDLPSPETTAALAGGFGLLVMGAFFVARSRRHELRLP